MNEVHALEKETDPSYARGTLRRLIGINDPEMRRWSTPT
jgi:hypothetical protein